MANITQNATIEIGPYTPNVPFNKALYIAEEILTSNDVLNPIAFLGVPGHLRPLLGAKAMYRLIGDGTHYPSFGPLFKETFDSFNYNVTQGVVNLITFQYDGTDFRYSITPNIIGYEHPRFVGNFGLGDNVIVIAGHDFGASTIEDTAPLPSSTRSAYNLLKSVHYTGTNPLIYSVSEDNITWVTSFDAKAARIARICSQVGPSTMFVKVGDGVMESSVLELTWTVTDQEHYCN